MKKTKNTGLTIYVTILTILVVIFAALTRIQDVFKKNNIDTTSVVSSISETISEETSEYTSELFSTKDSETTAVTSTDEIIINNSFDYSSVPEFTGEACYVVNNNIPYFSDEDKQSTDAFETYSSLDELGRCGVAYANICTEIMPTEERGEIGMIKPSGWMYNGKSNNNKYTWVDGKYIYNRCHLIGYQLAGENANEKNLITGTRYLNIEGMLSFENEVADYVQDSGNHVLYRVTPVFIGDELICRGVLMEAYSVEDNGTGMEFCVFCYNAQPGVTINYLTGQNEAA